MQHILPRYLLSAVLVLMPLLGIISAMTLTALCGVLALSVFMQIPKVLWKRPIGTLCAHKNAVIIMLLLFGWPLLSTLWSITPKESFTSALSMIGLVGVGILAANATSHIAAPSVSIAKLLPMMLAVASVLVVIELLPGGGIIQLGIALSGREDIYFLDKTINRGLCALALLVWPAMLMLHCMRCSKYAWVLLAVVALPIFLLHSLSAKMGIAVGALVWVLVVRWPQTVPKMLAYAVPLFLLIWPLAFMAIEKPLTASAYYEKLPISSQHRVEIWGFALGKVVEKPIAGWGMNTARAVPGHAELNAHGRTNMPLHPHNSVMQILLEQGIVGVLLNVAGIALLMRCWRLYDTDPHHRAAMGAGIVAYITVGFTAFGLWQTWWVAVGIINLILLSYFKIMGKSSRSRGLLNFSEL